MKFRGKQQHTPEVTNSGQWSRSGFPLCGKHNQSKHVLTLMHTCKSVYPAISAIWAERGRTLWILAISHALCFLLHPSALSSPRISWWSPHLAHSLSSVSLSHCPSQLCYLSVWAVWTGKPSTSCLR